MTPAPYIHANNRKTHCEAGHALTLDNLQPGFAREGRRRCRICYNAGRREQKARRKRGEGGLANADKDHCRRGHALTLDNCLPGDLARGKRRCRRCKAELAAARRRAIKAALLAQPQPEPRPFLIPPAPGSLTREQLAAEREASRVRNAARFAAALARSKSLEALHDAIRAKPGRPKKNRAHQLPSENEQSDERAA